MRASTRVWPAHSLFVNRRCLFVHLRCNFSCEVFVLLLKTFTCLKTNELLDAESTSVVLCNLLYILLYGLLVLSLYIGLVNQADFLQVLGEASLNQTCEDLVLKLLSLMRCCSYT